MINVLKYYYNFNDITEKNIENINNNIKINYKNNNYILYEIQNKEELIKQYNLCKNNNIFEKIILTIENKIITTYKNKEYVLIKKDNNNKFILFSNNIIISKNNILDKSSWIKLWIFKIDYIEYLTNEIRGKYKLIDESINYFIGLSETAISYLNYNKNNIYNYKTICRKRIKKNEMYNPLNIIIDNNMRDVGEYLKEVFWNNININIEEFINKLDLTYSNSILLISRLLYPSYYFDEIDLIINNLKNERVLEYFIFRIDNYEQFILKIYNLLKKRNNYLPHIDYIKNVNN